MKHVVISIFLFPWEIDSLERILTDLKQSACFLGDGVKFTLSVTMDVSDARVDWKSSRIPKALFLNKFENIKKLCNWCNVDFELNEADNCLGCVAKRRNDSIKYKNKCDLFMWLDPDMYFPMHILQVLSVAVNQIKNSCYVITPELIRYWDTSWDVITNKMFLNEPHNHRDYFDMYSINKVAQDLDAPYIEEISTMKFGGGWFTCVSHDLMQLATVPEFLGPYGLEDTWLMEYSMNHNRFSRKRAPIVQYVMRNVVVTEIGKTYIVDNHYKKFLNLKTVDMEAHKSNISKLFGQKLREHLEKTI